MMIPPWFYSTLLTSLLLSSLTGLLASMSSADMPQSSPPVLQSLQAEKQGIKGRVLRLTGDHMPQIQAPGISSKFAPGQRQYVQTKVWIFSGRIKGQSTRWAVEQAKQHPRLVGQVASNAEGEFSVGLPAGEYTLLAQYGSDLYLNAFQGDGNYASLKVTSGKTTAVDLVNNENATF